MEEPEEQEQVVTKEIYEAMTDKEKAEWIGIDSNDMLVSVKQFHEKLKSIGITYQYISDETEEYCRLEETIKKTANQAGIIEIKIKEDKEHICLRESKNTLAYLKVD